MSEAPAEAPVVEPVAPADAPVVDAPVVNATPAPDAAPAPNAAAAEEVAPAVDFHDEVVSVDEAAWTSTTPLAVVIDRAEDWVTQDYVKDPTPRVDFEHPFDSI